MNFVAPRKRNNLSGSAIASFLRTVLDLRNKLHSFFISCELDIVKEVTRRAMYVQRNFEARSFDHCCSGKTSITQAEFVHL
jgi:hypothetical protein